MAAAAAYPPDPQPNKTRLTKQTQLVRRNWNREPARTFWFRWGMMKTSQKHSGVPTDWTGWAELRTLDSGYVAQSSTWMAA
jgi:hypothetical protein